MATPLTDSINALTQYANETTGKQDTTLSDAVGSLVEGYGGSDEDELLLKVLNRTISGDVTINCIENLGRYAMSFCANLTSLSLPNCTEIEYMAFNSCSALQKVSLKNCTHFKTGYNFSNCNNIEEYYLPKLNYVDGQQNFTNPKVKCVVLPALSGLTNNCFYAFNAQLEKLDMLGGGLIKAGNFRNYSALKMLIFRNTSKIMSLYSLNEIETTPFGSSGSGGTIYVPQALISSYQTDSKWVTILGYENNQILPIEGSQYELYYADGSLIETY